MPKLARWQWGALSAVLLGASCTNDYEQFDFGARPDGSAGSAGTAQGSGGQLGSGPGGSSTGGAGGGDAQGGTGGGGSAGDAQGGSGAVADAQGGTSGGGTGGQAGFDGGGTSGTGGSCPGQFELLCSGNCVDGRGRANCGACSNDCEQQGVGTRFQCIDMRCGCTMHSHCGSMTSGARCNTLAARCICNGNQCEAGERCGMTQGNCSCNGGPPCSQGQICCQDGGCRTSCG